MHERVLATLARALDARLTHAMAVLDDVHEQLARRARNLIRLVGIEDVAHGREVARHLAVNADHVARGAPDLVVEAQHLLQAGNRALIRLLGELDDRAPRLLGIRANGGELVHAAERGLGVARSEFGSHTKGVDGCALCEEGLNGVFVQVIRDRDLHIRQACLVKGRARLFGELGQVAGIDADRREPLARCLHLLGDNDRVLDAFAHVIGIEQKATVLGARLGEGAERLELGRERHDPGVGVRAKDGDAVDLSGEHVRGRGGAGDVARASNGEATVRTLGAAQAEVGDRVTLGGPHHTGALGRDERLEVHEVEQRGLDELAIDDRADHTHHRLTREDDLALGNGLDREVEVMVTQVLEEILLEHGAAAGRGQARKVLDVFVLKDEVLHEVGDLTRAAGDGVAAAKGVLAEKRVEARFRVGEPGLPEPLGHRELVEVGVQADIGRLRAVGEGHGLLQLICLQRKAQLRSAERQNQRNLAPLYPSGSSARAPSREATRSRCPRRTG